MKNKFSKDGHWRFGTIVPLIGGMTISNQQATGDNPDFLISYPAFAGNDSHCVNHFKDTPYYVVDPETNELPEDDTFQNVDFVSAVCPCAGLSMLNTSKKRGSDAEMNNWMYKSAELVLEQIKPKVFWGENAPGLYTKSGEGVVKKLREIAEKNGYVLSLVKTNTFLHGIPQHRTRTFYFFWQGKHAPILNYTERDAPTLKEYLDQIPENASMQDEKFGLESMNSLWFKFLKDQNIKISDVQKSTCKSIMDYCVAEKLMPKMVDWGEENGYDKMVRTAKHILHKQSMGKGWWDATPLVPTDTINALISKNAGIVHPNGERPINTREALWLMGLPHDFTMVDYDNRKNSNHICQNVPVTTAKDWTFEVMKFINKDIEKIATPFLKQNNIKQRIDLQENKSKALF